MDKTPSSQHPTPVRAETFYFDDDPMAIFLVENQLFKVHRHFFIQGSEIFRDMFSQAGNCEGAEGMSDDKPIVLPDVTVKEFKTLLRYFYAMKSPIPNRKPLSEVLAFEQDEKLALLNIAHKFVFDNIFEYMCGEFEPGTFPVVDRVRLGDKCGLKNWLSSAYETILERTPDQKLSREEVDALGLERTIRILEAKIFVMNEVQQELKAALSIMPELRNSTCPYCSQWWPCNCAHWSNLTGAGDPVAMKNAVTRAVDNFLS